MKQLRAEGCLLRPMQCYRTDDRIRTLACVFVSDTNRHILIVERGGYGDESLKNKLIIVNIVSAWIQSTGPSTFLIITRIWNMYCFIWNSNVLSFVYFVFSTVLLFSIFRSSYSKGITLKNKFLLTSLTHFSHCLPSLYLLPINKWSIIPRFYASFSFLDTTFL